MAEITLEGITKRYADGTEAVKDIDLEIDDGEFLILVGPSGCGKSTALRMIAGLEDISEGELRIGGDVVNDKAPKDRDIAMVFQNYALYPHMTVRENMEFPLKMGGVERERIDELVASAAETLDLGDHLDRRPANLSGGQRQRVAMGRAIVREPKAFLMDEPLSNLDAKLRVQMRAEVSRLQSRLGTTTVYVTHDQTEAMTLGDRVAVMRRGELQQVGSPQELYEHPVNLFVAGFIGSPSMNFMPVKIEHGVAKLPFCEAKIPDEMAHALEEHRHGAETDLMAGIRPEHFEDASLVDADHEGPRFEVEVTILESMGSELYAYFDTGAEAKAEQLEELAADVGGEGAAGSGQVVARLSAESKARKGAKIELWMDPGNLHFFDMKSGERIAGYGETIGSASSSARTEERGEGRAEPVREADRDDAAARGDEQGGAPAEM